MTKRTLLINCGCGKKLCRKAVRLSGTKERGPVVITVLDGRRLLGSITISANRALQVVQWILVVPEDAQYMAWKLLSSLKS